jgi:hypothetical protein
MSSGLANDRAARAALRKMRHQPSWRLSQHAPTGMKAWWMRGCSSSQVRVDVVAGQVVGDDPDLPGRVGVLDLLQKPLVEDAVAGGSGHGDLLAVPDA